MANSFSFLFGLPLLATRYSLLTARKGPNAFLIRQGFLTKNLPHYYGFEIFVVMPS